MNNTNIPTVDRILDYLLGYEQEGGENWREENERYLTSHVQRFQRTLAAVPVHAPDAKLLELGATPFFMTLMLEHFMDFDLYLANGLRSVDEPQESSVRMVNSKSGEQRVFSYQCFNVELDDFPYPSNSFDLVLCCELLEHLALDPTHLFLEVHRILKPGGRLLVTTPNVLVLRNLISLLKYKKNIYYPYSGYGVYGRHNREWTLEEVVELLIGCGYSAESAQVVDTYPHSGYSKWLKSLFPFLRDMLLVIATPDREAVGYYPKSLYESLPRQYYPENPLPSRLQTKLPIG